jgi:hypothetical protein
MERQLLKKRPNVFGSAIYKKFDVKDFWKKDDVENKNIFLQNLDLLIMKNNLLL